MRFSNSAFGKIVLGIVFAVFMLVVSLVMSLGILPMVLIPLGVALVSPTVATVIGGVISLGILIFSFFVLGWAVFYFYRKNTFVYKSR